MRGIKIISNGIGQQTRIETHDGKTIEGVTSVKIDEITCKGLVTASLKFTGVQLEMQADWGNHPLKQWANRKTGKG